MKNSHKKKEIPVYWQEACKYLSQKDNIMKGLIKTYDGEAMGRKNNGFHSLARAIVGQQISVKAADAIWFRLEALVNNNLEPKAIIKLSEEQLRTCGLSSQKIKYLYNIAHFFINETKGKIDLIDSDHIEVAGKLIEIKGVGKWTVDMFMMFHMHSPDIFPIGDLGIINAVKKNYGIKAKDKKSLEKKILRLSKKWAPYRTVASWYLWRSIDPVAVEY